MELTIGLVNTYSTLNIGDVAIASTATATFDHQTIRQQDCQKYYSQLVNSH